jgi:HEAT repeat protein
MRWRIALVPFLTLLLLVSFPGGVVSRTSRKAKGKKTEAPSGEVSELESLARILKIEDERLYESPELEAFILRGPDKSVRLAALRAAGRIGSRKMTNAAVKALGDPDPDLRVEAAFDLGLIADPASVDALAAHLRDPESRVAAACAEALGRIVTPEVLKKLRSVLWVNTGEKPDEPLVTAVLDVLWRFGEPAVVSDVVHFARSESLSVRTAAAYCIMRLGTPDALPTILELLKDPDPIVRSYAARATNAFRQEGSRGALADALKDPDWHVRVNALKTLSDLTAEDAVPAMIPTLQDRNFQVKMAALQALQSFRGETVVEALRPYVGDAEPKIRALALEGVVSAASDEESLSFLTEDVRNDPSPLVRSVVARELGKLQREDDLKAMLGDKDPRVLSEVVSELAGVEGDAALPTLLDVLKDPDPVVRATAAEEIGKLREKAPVSVLREAYRRSMGDPIQDARLALLELLSKYKDSFEAKTVLVDALADPDWLIRTKAAQVAAAMGRKVDAEIIGPVGARRSLDFYRDVLLEARVPRKAVVRTTRGTIEIELLGRETPLTVHNFITLSRLSFYEGLTFHRVVPNFVIQGGCPRGDGWGGPGYSIRCEVTPRPYEEGTVGMALSGKDTGGSQFFIALSPQGHLDAAYTAFGRVTSGMDVAEQILAGDVILGIDILPLETEAP